MIFFTGDEHYFHHNILKYCNRPFANVDEMNSALIKNHNEVVSKKDHTVHVGDFTLRNVEFAQSIIRQLNGNHTFLRGSHDYWMKKIGLQIWEKKIDGKYVVACHYAMYSYPRSHYGSFMLHGHHHGRLTLPGKIMDVGVDTNNFYPYSFDQIIEIMETKPDTHGRIRK